MIKIKLQLQWLFYLSPLWVNPALADKISIAVASNFAGTMQQIVKQFENSTPHKVSLSVGSTGKHYAQIKNGAPFEGFFAADVKRPALLEQEEAIIPGSRFTYAVGRLVLWSPAAHKVDSSGSILLSENYRYIAIANPKLAPYGQAAQEVLQALGVWNKIQKRIVRAENVRQAFQFIHSGNADLGFVSLAQVKELKGNYSENIWEPSEKLFTPIYQQAVMLKKTPGIQEFFIFVKGKEAQSIIQANGYSLP